VDAPAKRLFSAAAPPRFQEFISQPQVLAFTDKNIRPPRRRRAETRATIGLRVGLMPDLTHNHVVDDTASGSSQEEADLLKLDALIAKSNVAQVATLLNMHPNTVDRLARRLPTQRGSKAILSLAIAKLNENGGVQ
jgi:hypothetical protein